MASYYIVLSLHILGATVWAGGHLVLAVSILPEALRQHRAATVSEFEQRFERIGLRALAVQIVTGLWLAERLLGSPDHWFDGNSLAPTVQVKLGLLAVTVGLAVHARFRVIPSLSDATLPTLAWHIRIVTRSGPVRPGRRQSPIRRVPRLRAVTPDPRISQRRSRTVVEHDPRRPVATDRIGRPHGCRVAHGSEPFGPVEERRDERSQLESCERGAGAHVDPGTVQEIRRRVAIEPELVGVTEHGVVAIRRCPQHRDPRTGGQRHAGEGDRTCSDAPVGDQRCVDAEDLVDGRRNGRPVNAQPRLDVGMVGEVRNDDSDTRGDRGELADGPVAHDADDLSVGEGPVADVLAKQLGDRVVRGVGAGLPLCVEHLVHHVVEPAGARRERVVVLSEGGAVLLVHPCAQRFVEIVRPAHERALHADRELMTERVHHLDRPASQDRSDQVGGDRVAHGLELRHRPGGEVRLDQTAVRRVLGRVHAVRDGHVLRHVVPVGVVVVENVEHVGVAQHRPPEQIAVCDGTAAVQIVVRVALVCEDAGRERIPLRARRPIGLIVHLATVRYCHTQRHESVRERGRRLGTVMA